MGATGVDLRLNAGNARLEGITGSARAELNAGNLDLTHLSGLVPKAQQASLAQSLKKAGLKTVPFDVWIDGHSLLRRVSAHVDHLNAGTAGAAASIRASFDIFDYGVKLTIVAPPASKTVDAGKLLAGLAGGTR